MNVEYLNFRNEQLKGCYKLVETPTRMAIQIRWHQLCKTVTYPNSPSGSMSMFLLLKWCAVFSTCSFTKNTEALAFSETCFDLLTSQLAFGYKTGQSRETKGSRGSWKAVMTWEDVSNMANTSRPNDLVVYQYHTTSASTEHTQEL